MEKEELMKKLRKICIVLIIVWMIVVFMFSNQGGSGSSGMSLKISKLLFNNDAVAEKMEGFIRKAAHITEYAIGAMLFFGYCLTYPKMQLKKKMIFSEMCIILYAITDEIHQLFIPGRNGNVVDILIDSCGGLIGIGVIWLAMMLIAGMEYKEKEEIEHKGTYKK